MKGNEAILVTEESLRQAAIDLLILDGWRHLRTDPVSDRATVQVIRKRLAVTGLLTPQVADVINRSVRGKGFGELGMADDLFVRYANDNPYRRVWAEVLWIEFKGPRGKAAEHQREWIANERRRGALVWLGGEDFPATPEGFKAHYIASGLARRVR